MSYTAHTPGPWGRNIAPASKYPVIYAGRNTHVAQVITRGLPGSEAEANADLITAAPELLAALEEAASSLEYACTALEAPQASTMRANLADCLAAIAKARGQ